MVNENLGFGLDSVGSFLSGLLDKSSELASKYFETRVAVTESEAELALARNQRDAKAQIEKLEQGTGASQWADPHYNPLGFQVSQNHLVLGALGLIAFAILKD